ncbi:MAG: RING finger domain-containing protein [Promethearchaeota archaeon]
MSDFIYNFCPFCGKKISRFSRSKSNYCSYCGKRLVIKIERSNIKVQCTICHKNVNPDVNRAITCSFCGSLYHESCVSSWLKKYNACPMCQNVYLYPNKTIIS